MNIEEAYTAYVMMYGPPDLGDPDAIAYGGHWKKGELETLSILAEAINPRPTPETLLGMIQDFYIERSKWLHQKAK